jgi:hypothetical protein
MAPGDEVDGVSAADRVAVFFLGLVVVLRFAM